ncbi:aldehyde dehydrogenase family protein [candidate division KSB1 bacterium]|nr:aldehyde dehydrogenase family protein [candidate division KSB1 bacterium]
MEIEPHRAVDDIMQKAVFAAAEFSSFDQQQTDKIVFAIYEAGFNARVKLAKMAHEETGIGRWQDKVMKNVVATQLVYEDIKDLKTVGIISHDKERGITEIASPMGPILAIIPVTNPTSTVLFKILSAIKARNPVIICPSKKAIKCCSETARICYEAAIGAGAPEDCIQWLTSVSREQTQELMAHKKLALILATGGGGLVHSAYSSGTPALGVGAGNVPVFIEKSADIPFAIEQIVMSKTFDNGTICASEQALVVEQETADMVISELEKRGAYFLSREEVPLLESVVWDNGRKSMNPDIVGRSAGVIAQKAGIRTPAETQLLVVPLDRVGDDAPLSGEILAPVLAFYTAKNFDEAVKICIDLNYFGGIGHTASIFSNDDEKINQFSLLMNAGRIVVNTPSSQGAVGGSFNTLCPSLTLGCGTGGKNITTENVTVRNLLNIQRITRRRLNLRLAQFDTSKYLDESLDARTIGRLYDNNY